MRSWIALLCFCGTLLAGLGEPKVQSVCQITLENGLVIEGYIVLARGGYHQHDQYGFAIVEHDSVVNAQWFNPVFSSQIEIFKKAEANKTVYYLDHFYPSRQKPDVELSFPFDTTSIVGDIANLRQYEFKKTIDVYLTLSRYLHVNSRDDAGQVLPVDVEKIEKLELVATPRKIFLDEIERQRTICRQEVAQNDNMQDFLEPVWYHELLEDGELPEGFASRFVFSGY